MQEISNWLIQRGFIKMKDEDEIEDDHSEYKQEREDEIF